MSPVATNRSAVTARLLELIESAHENGVNVLIVHDVDSQEHPLTKYLRLEPDASDFCDVCNPLS